MTPFARAAATIGPRCEFIWSAFRAGGYIIDFRGVGYGERAAARSSANTRIRSGSW